MEDVVRTFLLLWMLSCFGCKKENTEPVPAFPKGEFIREMGYITSLMADPEKKQIYYLRRNSVTFAYSGLYAFNYQTNVETSIYQVSEPDEVIYLHSFDESRGLFYFYTYVCGLPVFECGNASRRVYRYDMSSGTLRELYLEHFSLFGEEEAFYSLPRDPLAELDSVVYDLYRSDFDNHVEKLPAKGFPIFHIPGTTTLLMLDQPTENMGEYPYTRYYFDYLTYDSTFLDAGVHYPFPQIHADGNRLVSVHVDQGFPGSISIYDLYNQVGLLDVPLTSYAITHVYNIKCDKISLVQEGDEVDSSTGEKTKILVTIDLPTGNQSRNTSFNVEGIYEMVMDPECGEVIYSLEPEIQNAYRFNLYRAAIH